MPPRLPRAPCLKRFVHECPLISPCTACPQYSSRPFIVGDRIQLKSLGGSVIVAGKLGRQLQQERKLL